jgi:hypothetical protein
MREPLRVVDELVRVLLPFSSEVFPITLAVLVVLVVSLLLGVAQVWQGAQKEGRDPKQLVFIQLSALALAVISPLTVGVYFDERSHCEKLYTKVKAAQSEPIPPPPSYGNGVSHLGRGGKSGKTILAEREYSDAKCSWILGRRV